MKLKISILIAVLLFSNTAFALPSSTPYIFNVVGSPLLTWSQADSNCLAQLQAQGCSGASSPTGSCTAPSYFTFNSTQDTTACTQISLTFQAGSGCANTQAEVFFSTSDTINYTTTYDASLVNGFNVPVTMLPIGGNRVRVSTVNKAINLPGAFPWGCDVCTSRTPGPTGSPCPISTVPAGDLTSCSSAATCQYTTVPGIIGFTITFG